MIPRTLNNGYGYVPQLPGAGKFDMGETFGSLISGLGGLASTVPGVGSLVGLGLNYMGMSMQNKMQGQMYEQYQSPQARMQQMIAAGINPNTAASGIAGSATPSMQAASAPDAMGLGEAIGNSVNNALSAQYQMADIERLKSTKENIDTDTKLKESQNVGQQIENQNRQMVIDKTLREMDDKHEIDSATAHMLRNDAALSDALFDGKITQFWLQTQQMVQDIVNAEAEHNRILSEIQKNFAEANLSLEMANTESDRQRYIQKQTAVEEENRRYAAFRRNMISMYHYDPESTTEQNVAFALAIGDEATATYWAHTLGRYQANVQGWSEEKRKQLTQEFQGYQGFMDFCKFMAGGVVVGAAGKGMSVNAFGQVTPPSGYKVGNSKNYGNVSNYYTDPNATYSVYSPGTVQYK